MGNDGADRMAVAGAKAGGAMKALTAYSPVPAWLVGQHQPRCAASTTMTNSVHTALFVRTAPFGIMLDEECGHRSSITVCHQIMQTRWAAHATRGGSGCRYYERAIYYQGEKNICDDHKWRRRGTRQRESAVCEDSTLLSGFCILATANLQLVAGSTACVIDGVAPQHRVLMLSISNISTKNSRGQQQSSMEAARSLQADKCAPQYTAHGDGTPTGNVAGKYPWTFDGVIVEAGDRVAEG